MNITGVHSQSTAGIPESDEFIQLHDVETGVHMPVLGHGRKMKSGTARGLVSNALLLNPWKSSPGCC